MLELSKSRALSEDRGAKIVMPVYPKINFKSMRPH